MKNIGTLVIGDETITILQAQYRDKSIAIELKEADGGPYGTFSACIPGTALADGEFLAKTSSENEDLREPMLQTGLFVDTGRRVPSGFIELEVWKLTA